MTTPEIIKWKNTVREILPPIDVIRFALYHNYFFDNGLPVYLYEEVGACFKHEVISPCYNPLLGYEEVLNREETRCQLQKYLPDVILTLIEEYGWEYILENCARELGMKFPPEAK